MKVGLTCVNRVELEGLSGFQVFCHISISVEVLEGASARRSIFMSPLESIGIGCAKVEGGTERGIDAFGGDLVYYHEI